MFSKNLRYYRLKNNMSKAELASKCDLTATAISNYENGKRQPKIEQLKILAAVLGVKVSDFLAVRNENLMFVHGEFRKNSKLTQRNQDYIRDSVEEYFGRFFDAVEALGGEVLPEAPEGHVIALSEDIEKNAKLLRAHLGLAEEGPINEIISVLENKGILVYEFNHLDEEYSDFSGMNGFVNGRPYIVINGAMTAERNRSTIVHELAHLFFLWPSDMADKEIEQYATAISGAFLFPKDDAIRELGQYRSNITNDMLRVCVEYGVSMMLLVKRAEIIGIISQRTAKSFYIGANQHHWRTNEPTRIEKEKPGLLDQLVYRAVSEQDISIQKGAELLNVPYSVVAKACAYVEV